MNRLTLCVIATGLSACGQSTITDAPGRHTADYKQAIKCQALTEVVSTLVQAGAIRNPLIAEHAETELVGWQTEVAAITRKNGVSSKAAQEDFELAQLDLLGPVSSLPKSEAARHIEGIVHQAGDCTPDKRRLTNKMGA